MASSSSPSKKIQISIDRGGTFTDCIAIVPDRPEGDIVIKLLSVDPNNYKDAPREGVRRIMEIVEGRTIGRDEKLNTEGIGEYLRWAERGQSAKRRPADLRSSSFASGRVYSTIHYRGY